MSDCERWEEQISALLDGELPEPEAAAVRRHLETCADCRALYQAFSGLGPAVSETARAPLPDGLHDRVMTGLRQADRARKWTRTFKLLRPTLAMAASLAVIVGTVLAVRPLLQRKVTNTAESVSVVTAAGAARENGGTAAGAGMEFSASLYQAEPAEAPAVEEAAPEAPEPMPEPIPEVDTAGSGRSADYGGPASASDKLDGDSFQGALPQPAADNAAAESFYESEESELLPVLVVQPAEQGFLGTVLADWEALGLRAGDPVTVRFTEASVPAPEPDREIRVWVEAAEAGGSGAAVLLASGWEA